MPPIRTIGRPANADLRRKRCLGSARLLLRLEEVLEVIRMGSLTPAPFDSRPGSGARVFEPALVDVLRLAAGAADPDDLRHRVRQLVKIALAFLQRVVLVLDLPQHVIEGTGED